MSFAVLLVRLTLGIAFIVHGWPKIQSPMSWWPPDQTAPFGEMAMAVAAVAEFVGGAALALGFLTPLAAIGVLATMAGAVKYHFDLGHPWISMGASYELPLFYLVVALALLILGPGAASVDAMLFKKGQPSSNRITIRRKRSMLQLRAVGCSYSQRWISIT